MSKGKNKQQPTSPPTLPRNTVTLILDGTDEDISKNYEACQRYFRYWNFCRGGFRVRIGNQVFYTNPTSGTFYYVLRCKERSLVLVIDARQFWLTGWFSEHGFYQMNWEGNGDYMDVVGLIPTRFSGNHTVISKSGVGKTRVGLHELVDAFDAIWNYRGPKHAEPDGFREAIGRFVVTFMETKFKEICRRTSAAISGDFSFSRLGTEMEDLVHNWQSLSRAVMENVGQQFDTIDKINEIKKKIDSMYFLYVDAWTGGYFIHDTLPPPPRNVVWEAIDDGEGDGYTQHPITPDAEPSLSQSRGRGKLGSSTLKRGGKRGRKSIAGDGQETCKRTKTVGLRGGGLGGSSLVPAWFSRWSQDEDMNQCDELIKLANDELKLEFISLEFNLKESQGELPAANKFSELPTSNDGATTPSATASPPSSSTACPLSSSSSSSTAPANSTPALDLSHIRGLQGSEFVADDVVERYLNRLSTTFHSSDDGIAFIAPSVAHGLANTLEDPSTYGVDLSSQITVFPVNDSGNLMREGGSHWSLLVLDARGRPPQFIYHDSVLNEDTGNGFNYTAACRLSDRLRQLVPAAAEQEGIHEWSTPAQTNGFDCAVYMMAVASAISNWWRRSTPSERLEHSWSETVRQQVNSKTVALMRSEMAEMFLNNMDIKDMSFLKGAGP